MARLRSNILENATDLLSHGTENHAVMRIASGYLWAQYFPDAQWHIGGVEMTSRELMAATKGLLQERVRGFSAWGAMKLSVPYAFLNVWPLLGLIDFARDPEVRAMAEALVLYQCATLATNNFDGHIIPRSTGPRISCASFLPSTGVGATTPIHHTISWMLWDQNQVLNIHFTDAIEPTFAVALALTQWRMPEVITAVARGAGAPYEIRSALGVWIDWGRSRQLETLRYVCRERSYALGVPVAQWFDPSRFFIDYDLIGIAWKSDDMHRMLEVGHPHWRSNHGEDAWIETHSPFLQSAASSGTILVLYEFPTGDLWAGLGTEPYWPQQRDQHAENLMHLAQIRFPTSVDEIMEKGDT